MKQGCLLAPVHSKLLLSQILLHALKDLILGCTQVTALTDLSATIDSSLLAQSQEKLILEVLIADNRAYKAQRKDPLQITRQSKSSQLRKHHRFRKPSTWRQPSRMCKTVLSIWACQSVRQKRIAQQTKLKLHRTVVLSSPLHDCEIFSLYRRHITQLQQYL